MLLRAEIDAGAGTGERQAGEQAVMAFATCAFAVWPARSQPSSELTGRPTERQSVSQSVSQSGRQTGKRAGGREDRKQSCGAHVV